MEIEKTKGIIEAILFAAGREVTKNELMLDLEISQEELIMLINCALKKNCMNTYIQY